MYPESLNHRSPDAGPVDSQFVDAECVTAMLHAAAAELAASLAMIEHCLLQLSDDQIWRRDDPSLHAIGNTVLHLAGNLRQWIICGLGGASDKRHRPDEFTADHTISCGKLLVRLHGVVDEAREVLSQITAQELLRMRRIQGFEITGIGALWHAVPHFRGHTQELIRQTRTILGPAYQFAWTPPPPEEGSGDAAG
jgi:hypothetical protein